MRAGKMRVHDLAHVILMHGGGFFCSERWRESAFCCFAGRRKSKLDAFPRRCIFFQQLRNWSVLTGITSRESDNMARKKNKTNLISFLRLRFFIFLSSFSCFRLISLASNLKTRVNYKKSPFQLTKARRRYIPSVPSPCASECYSWT